MYQYTRVCSMIVNLSYSCIYIYKYTIEIRIQKKQCKIKKYKIKDILKGSKTIINVNKKFN